MLHLKKIPRERLFFKPVLDRFWTCDLHFQLWLYSWFWCTLEAQLHSCIWSKWGTSQWPLVNLYLAWVCYYCLWSFLVKYLIFQMSILRFRGLKELAQDFRANLRFVQSHLTPKPVSFVIIKRSPQQFIIFSQKNLLKLEIEDFLGKKEKSKS